MNNKNKIMGRVSLHVAGSTRQAKWLLSLVMIPLESVMVTVALGLQVPAKPSQTAVIIIIVSRDWLTWKERCGSSAENFIKNNVFLHFIALPSTCTAPFS